MDLVREDAPMDFFEVVKKRRSVRRFRPIPFPDEAVRRAMEAAILAPNSSNVQTWDFHWIRNSDLKARAVHACLDQSAARTASHLVVVTSDPRLWKRSCPGLVAWVRSVNAPEPVLKYYQRVVPLMYTPGALSAFAPVKWLTSWIVGWVRPTIRGPFTRRDMEEVAIKSAALAAENFALAITAQGGASCMMEGFDDRRLRRVLGLRRSNRIVMAIGIGYEEENGTWGPRYRLPLDQVVHVLD